MQQLRQRVIEVVTQAVQAYWELDYAWQNMAVQTEAVRLAERQYESNRRQAEQGILAPIDVVAAADPGGHLPAERVRWRSRR